MSAYRTYADFLSEHFKGKVQKLAINASLGCPNRDGTIGRGGCIYCNNKSFSPSYCVSGMSVSQQIKAGKDFFSRKYPEMTYLAYFQAYTSTHGNTDKLLEMYNEALSCDGIVGLIIGTRPDCLPDTLLDRIVELQHIANKPVIFELGAESTHNSTLRIVNRCHTWECTTDTVRRIKEHGMLIGLHFIMGLPDETEEMMLQTIDRLNSLDIDTVKFHQLQIIADTPLHTLFTRGEINVHPFSLDEYLSLCVKIVKRLNPHIAIERFTGQAPADMLIAPNWGIKNHVFTDKLNQLLANATD